ncbi:MAG: alcohol dehydrogenase catalytic domain-containing protein [Chloroflexi bacterium]|nr:alcohol dehydrogenase catalytic domain-containing protein [Chloroflexota bacterium]
MRAAVLYYPRELRIEERPEPLVGPDEVKVAVKVSGICGTDVHLYEGRYHPVGTPFPARVLGHDFVGVVTEVGERVTGVKPGDRVTFEPSRFCGHCPACRAGFSNLCSQWVHMGMTIDGCLQDYVVAPQQYVHPIPETLSDDEAATLEPVAVALHVIDHRLQDRHGDETVVVIGSGPIGLATVEVAKLRGHRVVAVEVIPERLELAARLGADELINPRDGDAARRILACCGERPNLIIETAGTAYSAQLALDATTWHGRIIFVALASTPSSLRALLSKEVWISGARAGHGSYPEAIRLVAEGRIRVGEMITHHFPLTALREAFELLLARPGEAFRVAIQH